MKPNVRRGRPSGTKILEDVKKVLSVIREVAKESGVPVEDIVSRSRKQHLHPIRLRIAQEAYSFAGPKSISIAMKRSQGAVAYLVSEYRRQQHIEKRREKRRTKKIAGLPSRQQLEENRAPD